MVERATKRLYCQVRKRGTSIMLKWSFRTICYLSYSLLLEITFIQVVRTVYMKKCIGRSPAVTLFQVLGQHETAPYAFLRFDKKK